MVHAISSHVLARRMWIRSGKCVQGLRNRLNHHKSFGSNYLLLRKNSEGLWVGGPPCYQRPGLQWERHIERACGYNVIHLPSGQLYPPPGGSNLSLQPPHRHRLLARPEPPLRSLHHPLSTSSLAISPTAAPAVSKSTLPLSSLEVTGVAGTELSLHAPPWMWGQHRDT